MNGIVAGFFFGNSWMFVFLNSVFCTCIIVVRRLRYCRSFVRAVDWLPNRSAPTSSIWNNSRHQKIEEIFVYSFYLEIEGRRKYIFIYFFDYCIYENHVNSFFAVYLDSLTCLKVHYLLICWNFREKESFFSVLNTDGRWHIYLSVYMCSFAYSMRSCRIELDSERLLTHAYTYV